MKVRATVTIELEAESVDAAGDVIHGTWSAGDWADSLNACIVVEDVVEVARFSWEGPVAL